MSNNIRRLLDELDKAEEAMASIVDDLERNLRHPYQEALLNEGEVWLVTLIHEGAYNIPAIRTEGGWVADPKWGEGDGMIMSARVWGDEDVYPHNKIH